MTPCVIKLDEQHLYSELSTELLTELLGDMVTRYESFFTFGQPVYPFGQAELLFQVLRDGYGLQSCSEGIGVEVVDLRSMRIQAQLQTDDKWKEQLVGRMLGKAFADTLTINRKQT